MDSNKPDAIYQTYSSRKIPNVHELDLRIKCLILKSQSSLADLLSYFVNKECKCNENISTEERLLKIIRKKRLAQLTQDNILIINNFQFDINKEPVPIQTLSPQEICGILLSKQMNLMDSICCCNECHHDCLSCVKTDGRQSLVHLDTVNCYKKKCSYCGEECKKEAFIKHLVLIQQLIELNQRVKEPEIYQSFKEDHFLEELEEFKQWEQLWKAVHKAVTEFSDFLCRNNYLSKDMWKDRDMDMRIVISKKEWQLNVLFSEDWFKLYYPNDTSQCESKPISSPGPSFQEIPASSSSNQRISISEEGIIFSISL